MFLSKTARRRRSTHNQIRGPRAMLPASVYIASPTIYARRGDAKDFPARSTRQQRGVVGGYVPVGWVVGWFGSGT